MEMERPRSRPLSSARSGGKRRREARAEGTVQEGAGPMEEEERTSGEEATVRGGTEKPRGDGEQKEEVGRSNGREEKETVGGGTEQIREEEEDQGHQQLAPVAMAPAEVNRSDQDPNEEPTTDIGSAETTGATSDADGLEHASADEPTPAKAMSSDEEGRETLKEGGEGMKKSLNSFQHLEADDTDINQLATLPEYTSDLSHVHQLLVLTEGETDLESDKEVPDIFGEEGQVRRYSDISGFHGDMERREVGPYVDEFTERARDEALLIGRASLQEIQAEEQRLQLEYLAYQEQEAGRQGQRVREVGVREEEAKRNVGQNLRKRRRAVEGKEARLVQHSMLRHKQLYTAFHKAEKEMVTALQARKAEVKALYGDLERAEGYYSAVRGRRWKVDWSEAPQPVQIKIGALRGVRDKLPASRYVLLISLYDRLGGHTLKWSRLKGQQWGATSLPVEHQGHYYNTELKFNQSIFTVLPSQPNIHPGMVLVFELFVLRGAATPTDRVVGWGVFPISDADFNIIEGKYKCPFLRGGVDPLIDKHSRMEKLMAQDIDNWLANLYFHVIKLPRYLQGMREYEVELQFTSSILGYPDRTHDERSVVDGNEPVHGGEGKGEDVEAILTAGVGPSWKDEGGEEGGRKPLEAWAVPRELAPQAQTSLLSPSPIAPPTASRAALASRLSRKFQADYLSSSSDSSSDEDPLPLRPAGRGAGPGRRDEGFQPVRNIPGLYYKVHDFNPLEEKQRTAQSLLPHTPLLGRRRRKAQSYEEALTQHTVSVKPPFSEKGRVERRIHERLQYVGRQFFSEMGLSQLRSLEFWGMLVILLLLWWVRMCLHYVAQYGVLRIVGIPVNRFDFYPHTVVLNYQSSLLFTREEIAIVVLGPFFNTLVFSFFILINWSTQLLFGTFPDLGSRFTAAFGIQAILDPYWIFLVDMALLRYQAPDSDMQTADASKLYWHFVRLEGSGIVGIFLTVFLYVFTTFTTVTCFYMYFLRVHMNGRLIDIYHRLKGVEEKFFMPHDMEVSNEELGYICQKAEQWRGAEGERRKVAVYDYVWELDELDAEWRRSSNRVHEVTTHISIHTIHLDGLRELYRHFLRLDNGAIIEIFGELSSLPGIKSGLKQALLQHHKDMSRPTGAHPVLPPSPPPPPPLSPRPRSQSLSDLKHLDDGSSPPDLPGTLKRRSADSMSPIMGGRGRSFASIPGQSTSGTPVKERPGLKKQSLLPVRTTLGSLAAGSVRVAVPPGNPSPSFNHDRSRAALDIDPDGYDSDDSVFEGAHDRLVGSPSPTLRERLSSPTSFFRHSSSPRGKGKGKAVEKRDSAGQLV